MEGACRYGFTIAIFPGGPGERRGYLTQGPSARTAIGGSHGVKNEGLSGPKRPTPFERILNALHVPYPVACILLAIIAGTPGFLLIEYAHSRDWDMTLRLVLSQPSGATWEGATVSALFSLVDVLVFTGVAQLRNRLVAAKEYLVGLAPDGDETYHRAFRMMSSWWPAVIALGLESVSAVSGLAAGLWGTHGPHFALLEVLRFLIAFGIITFVWVYATGLRGLHEIGKQPVRLKSYHEDLLLGTRPIGQISLRFAFSFFVILVLVVVGNTLLPDPWTFSIVVVFSIIAATMFFLPLNSIHRRMAETKGRETKSVRARFMRLMEGSEPPNPGQSTEPFARLDDRLRELAGLQVLDMEIRETGSIRTWPFDTRILGQLTVIILSVVAALIVRLVIVALPVLR